MALGTAEGQAHPGGAGGLGAILDGVGPELLLVARGGTIPQRVAVEACGDLLVDRHARKQVAGELLDGELVERQVLIDRPHNPVAVPPGVGAKLVVLVTVTLGEAGQVEPVAAPALTEMW